ncbi:peptidoglycan recognition family protein [Luteimonas sp. MC1572]|uniref:N-acetylmuramoyl-L-alanine amidase n=1 Tax=Luteimonas sp. MC1572 TaxID=2799325 RepID=UPI0018F0C9E6|nr:peptidoglycan recognition family protein [Luteimonas sp. MC1572]MBJ6982231.1 N-acetylmuramoyl-L-alanine amidase [Luteimonas sp. MC1572]QQO03507.1 N-acetylmuramoyl-L-alanine amidase [Luteimonas sp. MC1572]
MSIRSKRALSAATLSAGVLCCAMAAGSAAAREVPRAPVTGADALADAAAQREEAALETRLRHEETRLRVERAAYPGYFARAYAAYPAIPRGTLEALAFVQSRWHNVQPAADAAMADHHMPEAHGLMGLYAGNGFADQVAEAAALLGVSGGRVKRDPATNVMAAAVLLDRALRGHDVRAPEALAPVLAAYAGFAQAPGSGAIEDYARASFAFDVLLAMDRGVDEKGMVVPQRAIAWERAFPATQLARLNAPFVRLDVENDRIETDAFAIDPVSEQLVRKDAAAARGDVGAASTDYGPAIWDPAHSSNYNASRAAAVSAVTLHTAQGSYAGTISWFKNSTSSVSAHYVIRSSDGQVTQMVRNAHTAWHVRNQNSYTLGIEHEGYVNNSAWYTTAMYNASAALVRDFCAKYSAISCASAYRGAPSSGINVLPTSVKVKGHQHFTGQTHTDPGINWNWAGYYTRLNPGSGGTTRILDSFESNVGHFNTGPAYSGSTTGISAASTATRDCATRKNGSCSLRVLLKDNTATSASWAVRLLSGSGNPGSNTAITRANGSVGFWVFSAGSGLTVGVGVDDSDGTERSVSRSVPANTWTYVQWSLTDAAQWDAWVGNANGAITGSSVHLDAIWLYHANTSYDLNVYIDDVQARN